MRIGIIGVGNVGHALGDYLMQEHKIIGIDDLDIQAAFPVYKDYDELRSADAVFICLPSPFDEETNSLDNSLIENAVREIVKVNMYAPIYIKSTVNIGFTRKVANDLRIDRLYYTPEFLRQSSAYEDIRNPDRSVIGTLKDDPEDLHVVTYLSLFNTKKRFVMNYEEAEAVKLFSNTYLAMRIAFFNELDTYSEVNNLDSNKIIKAVCADKRIGDYYNKPSYGYGGYCLPKDSMELMNEYNAPQKLIEATLASNEVRKEHVANSILDKIKGDDDALVGIYGIPNKYSPLIDVINKLKAHKVNMLVYSPSRDVKEFNGIKVTDKLSVFIVDTSVILSDQELPEEFKNLEKVYLK